MTNSSLPQPRPDRLPVIRDQMAGRTLEQLNDATQMWQRTVYPWSRVWVRVNDVVVIDNDLFDMSDGSERAERPSPFLELRPRSRVQESYTGTWSVRTRIHRMGGTRRHFAARPSDQYKTRLWNGLIVSARNYQPPSALTRDIDWNRFELRVEAIEARSRQVVSRHRVHGADNYDMWFAWLGLVSSTLWHNSPASRPPDRLCPMLVS